MIRVTVDMNTGRFMVERGQQMEGELTEEEQKELEGLREQTEAYGDFTSFGDLNKEEIDQVTTMKKRRGELEKKLNMRTVAWDIVPEAEVASVVLVLAPESIPIYVENMPTQWIQKLFSMQLVIENPQLIMGASADIARPGPAAEPEAQGLKPDSNLGSKGNKIREILHAREPKLLGLVDVVRKGDFVHVIPKKFLGDDWSPVNSVLKRAFGEEGAEWKSSGRGDKSAHWEVI